MSGVTITAEKKRRLIEMLAGRKDLPADKYDWGKSMGLRPADTEAIWREAMRRSPHRRTSTPTAQ